MTLVPKQDLSAIRAATKLHIPDGIHEGRFSHSVAGHSYRIQWLELATPLS